MPVTKKKTTTVTSTQIAAKKEAAIKEAHINKEETPKKRTCVRKSAVKTTTKTTRKKVAPEVRAKSGLSKEDVKQLLDFVVQKLDEGKAEELVTISLAGKTSFTDYLVIASGTSSRHLFGLMNNLVQDLKKAGYNVRVSGEEGAGNWLVIDLIDVVVHLFTQEARDFYDLEGMWQTK